LLALLLIAAAMFLGYATWIVQRQGLAADELSYEGVEITVDALGIPTIEAAEWERVIEAQGFVHASQRMFQMDLARRSSAGRLSELFGTATIEFDRKRREEDWTGVAERAVDPSSIRTS
jgi:penicillin amidase